MLSMISCTYALHISSRNVYLEKMWTLPWSQTTHILNQALSMRVCDGSVHIYSNLINTVDELTVKSIEQILLHHMFLRRTREDKLFFTYALYVAAEKKTASHAMIEAGLRLMNSHWLIHDYKTEIEKCLSCLPCTFLSLKILFTNTDITVGHRKNNFTTMEKVCIWVECRVDNETDINQIYYNLFLQMMRLTRLKTWLRGFYSLTLQDKLWLQ